MLKWSFVLVTAHFTCFFFFFSIAVQSTSGPKSNCFKTQFRMHGNKQQMNSSKDWWATCFLGMHAALQPALWHFPKAHSIMRCLDWTRQNRAKIHKTTTEITAGSRVECVSSGEQLSKSERNPSKRPVSHSTSAIYPSPILYFQNAWSWTGTFELLHTWFTSSCQKISNAIQLVVYTGVSGPLRAELQHAVTHFRKVKHISDKRLWSCTNLSRYRGKKKAVARCCVISTLTLFWCSWKNSLTQVQKAWGKPKRNYHLILTICLEDIRNAPLL